MTTKSAKANSCYTKFKKKYIGSFFSEHLFCCIMGIVFIVIDDLFQEKLYLYFHINSLFFSCKLRLALPEYI